MLGTRRPLPWVASVVYVAVLLAGLYYDVAGLCPRSHGQAATTGFVAIMAGLLGLEVLEQRRFATAPRRLGVVLLVLRMVAFEAVALLDCSGFSRALALLVPFSAYFLLGRRASYLLALGYLAVGVVRLSLEPGWFHDAEGVSDLLMFFIGLVFAVSMAAVAVQAEAGRARLATYAGQVAELAAATERNRLARDIHDSVGHHLTAVSVQLEKAAAYRHRDADVAAQAVLDAHRSARLALADVRKSVGTLRGSSVPFVLADAMGELVDRARDSEFAVRLEQSGDESRHPGPALLALFRAAQEGLTNARRHAAANRVDVTVSLDPHCASLLVADNGQGFTVDSVVGHGLIGMRERLELVGGSLRVESTPGIGTRLEVRIPHAS